MNSVPYLRDFKILSGGQTGVDRAALDVALRLGIPCGGWCPKGRLAEDGVISERYPLQETPLADYFQRTEWNVRDSDALLILCSGPLAGGTRKALDFAQNTQKPSQKPSMILDLRNTPDTATVHRTLRHFKIINIAGPRESEAPGIYALASAWLERWLRASQQPTI